jgi:hypothetical protein
MVRSLEPLREHSLPPTLTIMLLSLTGTKGFEFNRSLSLPGELIWIQVSHDFADAWGPQRRS